MNVLRGLSLVVVACSSCAVEPGVGRLSLALTGQFFPGELTSLDLFIYDADATSCLDDGSLSMEPRVAVGSTLGVPLDEPRELTFTLPPNETYVVYARAGQRTGNGPLAVIARGCTTIDIAYQAEVRLDLHRVETCGNDVLDFQEMCDDGDLEPGDGCDETCATEAAWVNDVEGFDENRQYLPIAAGDQGLLAVCWQSDSAESSQAPMAWFDELGGDGEPFKETLGSLRRDCSDVDVLESMVLQSYSVGTGDLDTRNNLLTAWNRRDQFPPVVIGVREDVTLVAAFTGDSITTVALNAGRLALRTVSIDTVNVELLADEITYPVDETESHKLTPRIAGGQGGGFVVTWSDTNDDVWARLFASVSEGSEPQRLCVAPTNCSMPDVAGMRGSASDPYLVVYVGADERIVGRFIDTSGLAGEEFEISTEGDCAQPAVAPLDDETHEFVVVWTQPVDDVDHVFARVVSDVDTFGTLATGRAITAEPYQVTPTDGAGFDQPHVATAYRTGDPTTMLVFYRDIHGRQGLSDDRDSDIGYRLLRVTLSPEGM